MAKTKIEVSYIFLWIVIIVLVLLLGWWVLAQADNREIENQASK